MKKLATLLLAAGLVLGAATGASAIDFKAKGEWIMSFNFGQNGTFSGGNGRTGYNATQDEFEAGQRVRLQLNAVASEALSGTVYFEIGDNTWGQNSTGGALGADNPGVIELKNAYLDWMPPQSDLKIRMGIQGMALPGFVAGTQVFNDDVAGIVLNYKFNDNVALTALWARPFNDNYGGWGTYGNRGAGYRASYMDNVDAFALVLPLTFDGIKVTPWGMYAAMGSNAFSVAGTAPTNSGEGRVTQVYGTSSSYPRAGMMPVNGGRHKDGSGARRLTGYGDAWWLGLTGDITAFDPFRIAWDINYGATRWNDSHYNRAGWYAALLFEYKLDWGIPGIYGWYASGDDSDASNGSERMPSFSVNNENNYLSNYAFNGQVPTPTRDGVLGRDMTGTWGIGARLKDLSFVEDLKHTLRVNYIGGTNSPGMAKYFNGRRSNWNNAGISGPNANLAGMSGLYMTTQDSALEFGLTNEYKMYENFKVYFEANYIATWIDHSNSMWGRTIMNGKSDQARDPWNVNLGFIYSF